MCAGALRFCTHLKENIEKKMKKTYFSPETEIVLLNMNLSLLAGSITDEPSDPADGPVPEVPELPGDDDGGW